MNTIHRDTVLDALNDAGLEEDQLYEGYSGRGMYGETCFGIVGSMRDVLKFAVALGDWDPDEAYELVGSASTDSMGMDTIVYFPGWGIDDAE